METYKSEYINSIVELWVLMIRAKYYNKITPEEFNNLEEKIEQLNFNLIGRKLFDGI